MIVAEKTETLHCMLDLNNFYMFCFFNIIFLSSNSFLDTCLLYDLYFMSQGMRFFFPCLGMSLPSFSLQYASKFSFYMAFI